MEFTCFNLTSVVLEGNYASRCSMHGMISWGVLGVWVLYLTIYLNLCPFFLYNKYCRSHYGKQIFLMSRKGGLCGSVDLNPVLFCIRVYNHIEDNDINITELFKT